MYDPSSISKAFNQIASFSEVFSKKDQHISKKRGWMQSGFNPTDILGSKVKLNSPQNFVDKFIINGGSTSKGVEGVINPARPKQFYTVTLGDTQSGKDIFKLYSYGNMTDFRDDFNYLVKDISLPEFGLTGDHTFVESKILAPNSNEISIEFLEQEQSIIEFFFLNWLAKISNTHTREINKVNIKVDVWDMEHTNIPLVTYSFLQAYPKNIGLPQLTQDENLNMYRKVDFYFNLMQIERHGGTITQATENLTKKKKEGLTTENTSASPVEQAPVSTTAPIKNTAPIKTQEELKHIENVKNFEKRKAEIWDEVPERSWYNVF